MQEQGRKVPFLDNMPPIDEDALPYWETYNALRLTCQSQDQHVSFTELNAYFTFHGITSETEKDRILYVIRELEKIHMAHRAKVKEKQKQQAEKPPPPQRTSRRTGARA